MIFFHSNWICRCTWLMYRRRFWNWVTFEASKERYRPDLVMNLRSTVKSFSLDSDSSLGDSATSNAWVELIGCEAYKRVSAEGETGMLPISKQSKILMWIVPSSKPTSKTSTESLEFRLEWNIASIEARLLKTSSLELRQLYPSRLLVLGELTRPRLRAECSASAASPPYREEPAREEGQL